MCESKSFTLWLLQVVVLLGLLAFFLWLMLHPKAPTYTIVGFSVPVPNNGSNTTTAGQGYDQNGSLTFYLEIKNPNKDSSVYYDDILLTFYYNQDTVGERTLPSFHQDKDKTSQFIDKVDANARVWKTLGKAIANKTAEVKVDLVTKFRYNMWGRTSKHHGMNLQGRVPIGSDGKISGKKKIKLRKGFKKLRLKVT
ncbi:protein NDR1-like [Cornus florida]|uniref:protein NDR1-like n=1 Tax=Cornus florida TaxID=4283 RepID=UPI00289E36B7|nr:protein NDR1-like [Cornus florida]